MHSEHIALVRARLIFAQAHNQTSRWSPTRSFCFSSPALLALLAPIPPALGRTACVFHYLSLGPRAFRFGRPPPTPQHTSLPRAPLRRPSNPASAAPPACAPASHEHRRCGDLPCPHRALPCERPLPRKPNPLAIPHRAGRALSQRLPLPSTPSLRRCCSLSQALRAAPHPGGYKCLPIRSGQLPAVPSSLFLPHPSFSSSCSKCASSPTAPSTSPRS